MPYRLAYSLNAYTRRGVLEALDDVARLGFDGAELLCDAPHWDEMLRLGGRQLRLELDRRGLGLSNLNVNTSRLHSPRGAGEPGPGPTFLDDEPEARRLRLRHVREAFRLAEDLGATHLCVSSGPAPAGATAGAVRDRMREALEALLAEADRRRIGLAVEFEPDFYVGRTGDLLDWIGRMNGHPRLGANLDLGHAEVVGDAPAEAIRRLKGRIHNLHIEDIKGRVHHHLVPGEGDIDFLAIRRALDETGYDRYVTVELYTCAAAPTEAGRRSLEFLRRIFG